MAETTRVDNENTAIENPRRIKRKIGMTTYEVSLYFSKTSTESMSDKVMRLLKNDPLVKEF